MFHEVLQTDEEPWNRAFAGMVLFCAYARSRWSDAQHREQLIEDRDELGSLQYLECSTGIHKTVKAIQLRHPFLPLVAPANGIVTEPWGEHWFSVRQTLGIYNLELFPLMPAPDMNGDATVLPLGTAEAKAWLHMLLTKGGCKLDDLKITTHSLKATFWSYLKKRGCGFEDRLILGYHTNSLRMALTYSRDATSRPLRILESLIQEIRDSVFFPDATRNGRLKTKASEVVETQLIKKEVSSDVIESSDSESDSLSLCSYCTTDSSSESDDQCVVAPRQFINLVEVPNGVVLWQHRKLKTPHLMRENYNNVSELYLLFVLAWLLVQEENKTQEPRSRFE